MLVNQIKLKCSIFGLEEIMMSMLWIKYFIIKCCLFFIIVYLQNNRTPLFDAVDSDNIEILEVLLNNGAKTDVVDEVKTFVILCMLHV